MATTQVTGTAKAAPAKADPKAAKPSARPGTPDTAGEKPAKEKVKRVIHPSLIKTEMKDGKPEETRVRVKDIPADFDAKIHKPLQRRDFEDEGMWYELQARKLDEKAAKLRQLAKESKALGNTTERAKTKRLVQMNKKMLELADQLRAAGVPVDDILAKSGVTSTTNATPAPAAAG